MILMIRAAHVQVDYDEFGNFPDLNILSPKFDSVDFENFY